MNPKKSKTVKELTDSNIETRNSKNFYLVIGLGKNDHRADGLDDVYDEFACFKRYHHAKKWIEKNKTEYTDFIIVEQVIWLMSKNLNYALGKRKSYWKC